MFGLIFRHVTRFRFLFVKHKAAKQTVSEPDPEMVKKQLATGRLGPALFAARGNDAMHLGMVFVRPGSFLSDRASTMSLARALLNRVPWGVS